MQVHIRHAMSDKCSQEAAPDENAPHVLFHIKKKDEIWVTFYILKLALLIMRPKGHKQNK